MHQYLEKIRGEVQKLIIYQSQCNAIDAVSNY